MNTLCLTLLIGKLACGAVLESANGEKIVARYQVDLASHARAVFALPPGPQEITKLIIEPDPGTATHWSRTRVRLVWESGAIEQAAIDIPGSAWRGTRLELAMKMPYRRQGRLIVDSSSPIRGVVRVESTPGQSSQGAYLHGQVREKPPSGSTDQAFMYYWYSEAEGRERPPLD